MEGNPVLSRHDVPMELAGLEPATSWVRCKPRFARPDGCDPNRGAARGALVAQPRSQRITPDQARFAPIRALAGLRCPIGSKPRPPAYLLARFTFSQPFTLSVLSTRTVSLPFPQSTVSFCPLAAAIESLPAPAE